MEGKGLSADPVVSLVLTSDSVAGLYVHVPFHREASASSDDAVDIETADVPRFGAAIRDELRACVRPHAVEEPITTVYVGGGRPSLLSRRTAHALSDALREVLTLAKIDEVTVELNPADVQGEALRALQRRGVNRLSLDVRSFDPEGLRAYGAPHSADDALRALHAARTAGIDTLSIDLLFGHPDQPRTRWKADLRRAVEMQVPHITILEVPPASRAGASAEARADCLEFAMTFLDSAGYEQYELTHFARPGHRSVHQERYYAHENQLGVGPSAESFWWPDRSATEPARRWVNLSDLNQYALHLENGTSPVACEERLDRPDLAREYMLLRLRTSDGLDLNTLASRYGVELHARKSDVLNRLVEAGLIHDDPARVRLTRRGRLLTDAIAQRLLPSRPH